MGIADANIIKGFPDSSVGKESACNAGDPDLIPGLGKSAGEGIGYPLQYSWASLVAQLVKNLPSMQETWVRSPGEGNWRIPWTVHGITKSRTRPSYFHFTVITGLPWFSGKESTCNARDLQETRV